SAMCWATTSGRMSAVDSVTMRHARVDRPVMCTAPARVAGPERQDSYPLHGRLRPVDHALLLQRGLRRGEPGDRNAERRARHVIHAGVVAELHRARLAAVLAANPDLQIGASAPAQPHRDLDELADPFLVEHLEGVLVQDTVLDIEGEEPAGVVP